MKYEYLDDAHLVIKYTKDMGEIKNFDVLKSVLKGKPILEQRKYFYYTWSAPRFATTYTALYESKDAAIVHDGIIVGIIFKDGGYLLVDTGMISNEASDNNGAGYKEYSEHTHLYFTKVPLDIESCNYEDREEYGFFESHKHLKEVVIDERTKYIGTSEVTCPVKYIGTLEHWLEMEGWPSSLKEIHFYLKNKEEETTRIAIPEKYEHIYSNAFYNCVGLKEIYLPRGLISIQADAFHSCTSLEKIEIPDNVNAIHHDAFRRCYNLKHIKFPSGPFRVARAAFSYCTALKEVTIPANCELMLDHVFADCDEKLKIKCLVPAEKVNAEWSNTWNLRYSDRDGAYYYNIQWMK